MIKWIPGNGTTYDVYMRYCKHFDTRGAGGENVGTSRGGASDALSRDSNERPLQYPRI